MEGSLDVVHLFHRTFSELPTKTHVVPSKQEVVPCCKAPRTDNPAIEPGIDTITVCRKGPFVRDRGL